MSQGRKPGTLARFACKSCGTVELVRGYGSGFLCTPCKADNPIGAAKGLIWHGGPRANAAVSRAVREGVLAHPSTLACADCSKPAQHYDHRDYNFPLAVAPVCRSCNGKRGPAIPLRGAVERMLSSGRAPYVNGSRLKRLCNMMGRSDVAAQVPARKLTIDDWHVIWPELLGTKGSPRVKPKATA